MLPDVTATVNLFAGNVCATMAGENYTLIIPLTLSWRHVLTQDSADVCLLQAKYIL